MFERAEVPVPQSITPVPSIQEMTANATANLRGSRRDIALGVPTEGQARAVEEQARETAATAGMRAGAVEAGGAAGRAVAQVPSEEVAGAAEETAVSSAEAQQAEAARMKALHTNVTERMASDPEFRGWAEIVSIGLLPLYTARLYASSQFNTAERQQKSDKFNLLFEPIRSTDTVFNALHQRWEAAKTTYQLKERSPEEMEQWLLENPEPTPEQVQADLVLALAQQLFPDAATPEEAVDLYFSELRNVTDMVNQLVPEDRRSSLMRARDIILNAPEDQRSILLGQAMARLSDFEQAELRRLIAAATGQNK
jgi:hypothetical protein